MRRGRPTATSQPPQQPQQNPSPAKVVASSAKVVTNGDPFAALDTKFPAQAGDELSNRFPTLDQFAILHDHGTKFEFDSTLPPASQPQAKDPSQRLAEKLADDAFQIRPLPSLAPAAASQGQSAESSRVAAPPDVHRVTPPLKSTSAPPKQAEMSRASAIISSTPELKAISTQASKPSSQPAPEKPSMVSTGTMTTPPPERQTGSQAPYPIYRFPADDRHRASSLPRQPDSASTASTRAEPNPVWPGATGSRTPSQQPQLQPVHIRHPSSSRPSLEGGRPSQDLLDSASKSKPQASSRPRPVSTHLESNLEYLRGREMSLKPLPSPGHGSPKYSVEKDLPSPPEPEDETNIESNVEFLRAMEDMDHPKKKDGRAKHTKRSSLTSLGAGTKNILAGKFGDAFKRFEGGGGPAPPRTPSPLKDMERRDLTPIAGSEATDGRSDDGQVRDYEEMTPEMRREQESRMLAQEEARVAAAQAEYRQRVAQRGTGGASANPTPLPKSIGGVSRAVSIQNKVQSLLDETNRSSTNVTRTAQGYGQYSDSVASRATGNDGRPVIPRKPLGGSSTQFIGNARQVGSGSIEPASTGRTVSSIASGRPAAPPKPIHLGMVTTGASSIAGSNAKAAGSNAGLVASEPQLTLPMTAAERDDYLRDFQKRFPSLTSIEMVERDLAAEAEGGENNTGRAR